VTSLSANPSLSESRQPRPRGSLLVLMASAETSKERVYCAPKLIKFLQWLRRLSYHVNDCIRPFRNPAFTLFSYSLAFSISFFFHFIFIYLFIFLLLPLFISRSPLLSLVFYVIVSFQNSLTWYISAINMVVCYK
jgi:hypothetical protein